MTFEDNKITLEVKDSVPSDVGDYKFKASNKVGEVTSQASLTVHSKWIIYYSSKILFEVMPLTDSNAHIIICYS